MIKNIINKLKLSKQYQVYIKSFCVWTLITAVSGGALVYVTNLAFDAGYETGIHNTVIKNQHDAINAGVAEFVITNKLSGESSFRYKSNKFRSTLF